MKWGYQEERWKQTKGERKRKEKKKASEKGLNLTSCSFKWDSLLDTGEVISTIYIPYFSTKPVKAHTSVLKDVQRLEGHYIYIYFRCSCQYSHKSAASPLSDGHNSLLMQMLEFLNLARRAVLSHTTQLAIARRRHPPKQL